jgi:uncharacterized protein YutE (UPF0331/DUF86 family)
MDGDKPMRLDLYQAETERSVREQTTMMAEARQKLQNKEGLSALEQAGVLHALQILIENAIGKAKNILKATEGPVPISAYDAFASLKRMGAMNAEEYSKWSSAIGIRNRIVHEYMNLKMDLILNWVKTERYRFIVKFLEAKMDIQGSQS